MSTNNSQDRFPSLKMLENSLGIIAKGCNDTHPSLLSGILALLKFLPHQTGEVPCLWASLDHQGSVLQGFRPWLPPNTFCGWWSYRRTDPYLLFRLRPTRPHGPRPGHQLLSLEDREPWLHGGTPETLPYFLDLSSIFFYSYNIHMNHAWISHVYVQIFTDVIGVLK